MTAIPAALGDWALALKSGGSVLEYTFDARDGRSDIPSLLRRMGDLGLGFKDLSYRAANSRYLPGQENPDWAITRAPNAPVGVPKPVAPR